MAQRKLSSDDRAVWKKITEGTKPLGKAMMRAKKYHAVDLAASQKDAFTIVHKKKYSSFSQVSNASLKQRNLELFMDQKVFLKMTRGRMEPNAKIDLHGYTTTNAFPALSEFIQRNYNYGHRLVLVITGKGNGKNVLPDETLNTGVLKNQVPKWLASPAFRNMILQVHHAHTKHGGSGALYVYLRRKKKFAVSQNKP